MPARRVEVGADDVVADAHPVAAVRPRMGLDDDGDELEHRQRVAVDGVAAGQLLDLRDAVVEAADPEPAERRRPRRTAVADEPVRGEDLAAAAWELRCRHRGRGTRAG